MGHRVDFRGRHTHKEQLSLKHKYVFVIEKYVRDIIQGQNIALDLLESVMRPSRPAKGELQRILINMNQVRPPNPRIRVSTFWMSGKVTNLPEPACRSKAAAFSSFYNKLIHADPQNEKELQVLVPADAI